MSSAIYPQHFSNRVRIFVAVTLSLWLAATLGADALVQPVQEAVQFIEQLFGLHIVAAP